MSAPATEHEHEVGRDRHARPRNLVVRASSCYLQWLERLAVAEHMPVSVLVDRAINNYAARVNFDPAPKR